MKIFTLLSVFCSSFLVMQAVQAQESWPKTASVNGTTIKMYQWQPESMEDNTLNARAAISVLASGKSEPVFGVAWIKATTVSSGQQVQVQSIYITDIKLPEETDDATLESYAVAMEGQAPGWNIAFSSSELQVSLDLNKQQTNLSQQINNTPPKVIYSTNPSILVLIDGAPKLQYNSEWGVEAVVNTPFAIVKNNDGRFYLYGGKHWYTATSATGSYKITTNVPSSLLKIEQAVNEANKDNEAQEKDANTIYNIIVSTQPAELIQSNGEAQFAPVQGTGLLYVSNSDNDIFMDVDQQQYYVLISGRWYRSKTLTGNWEYTGADHLPEDFAKIPEGSPKDNVLASIAGTEQAEEAIKEAQVPQTAKVDRNNASADISYDGEPEFEAIDGTDMYYAINSPASVIRWRGRYYAVDNGIWFESYSSAGPWQVSVERPYVVALIPPRYPVYYMKYVYIYDVTPDYIYMGYTPGYLNTFIYGPTVVYGTGYYYRPWHRRYYYPRPCTWGYGVRYNPWFGWGLNVGFSTGWFYSGISIGNSYPGGYWGYGGWWGPRVYRPPYCYSSYSYRGGYYGGGGRYGGYGYRSRNTTVINYNTNIYNYNNRRGVVVTRNNERFVRNDRYNNGRQNWAGNNNNRFNNNNRNRSGDPSISQPGNRFRDRSNGPVRQYNPGNNDNNRTGRTSNGIYNRNRANDNTDRTRNWRSTDGSSGNTTTTGRITRPNRETIRRSTDNDGNNPRQFNRGNNSNNPGRITAPPTRNAEPSIRNRNNDRPQIINRGNNDNGNPGRITTPPTRNSEPSIRNRNNDRPQIINRGSNPGRVVTPPTRNNEPSIRNNNNDRPRIINRGNDNNSNPGRIVAPPTRNSEPSPRYNNPGRTINRPPAQTREPVRRSYEPSRSVERSPRISPPQNRVPAQRSVERPSNVNRERSGSVRPSSGNSNQGKSRESRKRDG